MTIQLTTPSLIDLLGPVPYWLIVVMLGSVAVEMGLNAVTTLYGEITRRRSE